MGVIGGGGEVFHFRLVSGWAGHCVGHHLVNIHLAGCKFATGFKDNMMIIKRQNKDENETCVLPSGRSTLYPPVVKPSDRVSLLSNLKLRF